MKIQIITILIILSFIYPSFHFIGHEHNYNPFTKKLEHIHHEDSSSCTETKTSQFAEVEKEEERKEVDLCQTILNNKIDKGSEYSPVVKTLKVNKYIYITYYSPKKQKSNNLLFIAPKNSPPYFA